MEAFGDRFLCVMAFVDLQSPLVVFGGRLARKPLVKSSLMIYQTCICLSVVAVQH